MSLMFTGAYNKTLIDTINEVKDNDSLHELCMNDYFPAIHFFVSSIVYESCSAFKQLHLPTSKHNLQSPFAKLRHLEQMSVRQ